MGLITPAKRQVLSTQGASEILDDGITGPAANKSIRPVGELVPRMQTPAQHDRFDSADVLDVV